MMHRIQPYCPNRADAQRRAGRSGRLRHPLLALSPIDLLAVVLGQAAPDSVGLPDRECVAAAVLDHRAPPTDRDRLDVPAAAGRAALVLGVEEEPRIGRATGPLQLPFPQVCDRARESGEVSHCDPPS